MKRSTFESLSLTKHRRITAGHYDLEHPAWSPDGRWLVFVGGAYGATDLFLVDRRGRFSRRLTGGSGIEAQPAWSPDGARIAFRYQKSARSTPAIHVASLTETASRNDPPPTVDGGPKIAPIPSASGAPARQPAYSPDGRRLALAIEEGSSHAQHIAIIDLETGKRRSVSAEEKRNDGHPAWSPDGRRLAFHRYEGLQADRAQIHVLDVESGKTERVTRGRAFSKHPTFAGEDLLLFQRETGDREPGVFILDLSSGRERRLCEGKHPAAVVRSGVARVAFTARDSYRERRLFGPTRPNFDIFTAEITLS